MDDIIRKYEERDELANQAPTAPVITAEAPAPESKQATTAKYEKAVAAVVLNAVSLDSSYGYPLPSANLPDFTSMFNLRQNPPSKLDRFELAILRAWDDLHFPTLVKNEHLYSNWACLPSDSAPPSPRQRRATTSSSSPSKTPRRQTKTKTRTRSTNAAGAS